MKHFVFLVIFLFSYGILSAQKGVTNSNSAPATINTEQEEMEQNAPVINSKSEKKKVDMDYKREKEPSSVREEKATSVKEVSQKTYQIDYSINHQRSSRSANTYQKRELEENVLKLKASAPESFEFHYFSYVSSQYDTAAYFHLLKAEKLKPDNSDLHVQLLAHSIISDKVSDQKKYAARLVKSGRITHEMLSYNRDLLASVPSGSFLITHGDDDTYGSTYLQLFENSGLKINIVSLELLQSDVYRAKMKKLGLKIPNSRTVDVQFLKQLCELNSSIPLYLSLTIPKEYFEPMQGKLYANGLSFRYADKEVNNILENERLWTQVLQKNLVYEAASEKARELSANYLPMLFALRKYYNTENDSKKLSEIDSAINSIGSQCNKYEQVQKLKQVYK